MKLHFELFYSLMCTKCWPEGFSSPFQNIRSDPSQTMSVLTDRVSRSMSQSKLLRVKGGWWLPVRTGTELGFPVLDTATQWDCLKSPLVLFSVWAVGREHLWSVGTEPHGPSVCNPSTHFTQRKGDQLNECSYALRARVLSCCESKFTAVPHITNILLLVPWNVFPLWGILIVDNFH